MVSFGRIVWRLSLGLSCWPPLVEPPLLPTVTFICVKTNPPCAPISACEMSGATAPPPMVVSGKEGPVPIAGTGMDKWSNVPITKEAMEKDGLVFVESDALPDDAVDNISITLLQPK